MESFGAYELVSRINIGGMAEVFRARRRGEAGFVKESVLKRILPHYSTDDEFTTMFVDEALIAANLRHPNIVQVYDFGQVGGIYFIDMELVEGFDVRRITREGAHKKLPLGANRAVQIALGMVKGLGYAHQRNDDSGKPLRLIHRDVSPHNVLVSFDGDVKVMDFGIAKAAARATKTSTGVVKGKLAYMSPEQAEGKEIDHRTDVFATGVCLWEMIAERRLFVGDSEMELLEKVRRCETPSLREVAGVPESLARCVEKFLARDRDERYQSMRDAERDLSHILHELGGAPAAPLDEYMRQVIPPEAMRAFTDEPERGTRPVTPSGSMSVNTQALTDQMSDAATRVENPTERTRSGSLLEPSRTLEKTRSSSYHPPVRQRSGWVYAMAIGGVLIVAGVVVAAVGLPRTDKPKEVTVVVPPTTAAAAVPPTTTAETLPPSAAALPPPAPVIAPSHPVLVEKKAAPAKPRLTLSNAANVTFNCPEGALILEGASVVRKITHDNHTQSVLLPAGMHKYSAKLPNGHTTTFGLQDFVAGDRMKFLDCD
jgi:serine/threonine protein kinase